MRVSLGCQNDAMTAPQSEDPDADIQQMLAPLRAVSYVDPILPNNADNGPAGAYANATWIGYPAWYLQVCMGCRFCRGFVLRGAARTEW